MGIRTVAIIAFLGCVLGCGGQTNDDAYDAGVRSQAEPTTCKSCVGVSPGTPCTCTVAPPVPPPPAPSPFGPSAQASATFDGQDLTLVDSSANLCMYTRLIMPPPGTYLEPVLKPESDGKYHLREETVGSQATCWPYSSFRGFKNTRLAPWSCAANSSCVSSTGLPFASSACFMTIVSDIFDGNGLSYPPELLVYADSVNYPTWTLISNTTDHNSSFTALCAEIVGRTGVSIVLNVSGDVPQIALPPDNVAACGFSGITSKWADQNEDLGAYIYQDTVQGVAGWTTIDPAPAPLTQANITCLYF